MNKYENSNIIIFNICLKIVIIFIIVSVNKFNLKNNIVGEKENLFNNTHINNNNNNSNIKYIESKKIMKFNNNNISILKNKYFLFYSNSHQIFFNISVFNFSFSFKFGISTLEYYIGFYEKNSLIYPSDLSLYKNLHIFCNINRKNRNEELFYNRDSIPNIYANKYFKYIEFFNNNDTLEFGIKIYQKNIRGNDIILTVNIFNGKELNYNNLKFMILFLIP